MLKPCELFVQMVDLVTPTIKGLLGTCEVEIVETKPSNSDLWESRTPNN